MLKVNSANNFMKRLEDSGRNSSKKSGEQACELKNGIRWSFSKQLLLLKKRKKSTGNFKKAKELCASNSVHNSDGCEKLD